MLKLAIRITVIICLIILLIDLFNNLYQIVTGMQLIDNVVFYIITIISLVIVLIYTGYTLLKHRKNI